MLRVYGAREMGMWQLHPSITSFLHVLLKESPLFVTTFFELPLHLNVVQLLHLFIPAPTYPLKPSTPLLPNHHSYSLTERAKFQKETKFGSNAINQGGGMNPSSILNNLEVSRSNQGAIDVTPKGPFKTEHLYYPY